MWAGKRKFLATPLFHPHPSLSQCQPLSLHVDYPSAWEYDVGPCPLRVTRNPTGDYDIPPTKLWGVKM